MIDEHLTTPKKKRSASNLIGKFNDADSARQSRPSAKPGYITKIDALPQLSPKHQAELKKITEKFPFRVNSYYLSLINWDDPDDPIRRIIIPDVCELDEWGRLDPSDEGAYTVCPGVEHKYNSTALLLVSDVCEGICRYCFRKRVFTESQSKHRLNLPAAMGYLKKHTEITNVLLTGGDPLTLSTPKLKNIIRQLSEIDHIRIIRIGTRVPVFNPYRITEDPDLLKMIKTYSTKSKKIYVMTHFVHPNELTDIAVEGVELLQKTGALMTNQMPLIRGVNDKPEVLAQILAKLSFIGAVPYYVFQCRPALGNKAYTVPIEEGYDIFERAKALVSGLAKRSRYVMSHSTGKIEIVGKTENRVYFKYHRAARDEDSGKFMVFKSNPKACWFDDYDEVIRDYPVNMPYRTYGPE